MSAIAVARVPDPIDPVDHYIDATFERFHQALVAATPGLVEPRAADLDRARRRLALLVETIAGLAVGITVGQVATVIRRGFGAEVRAAVEDVVARIARGGPDDLAAAGLVGRSHDGDASLARSFPQLLWPRLCGSVGVARARVRRLEATVTAVAPDQRGPFARALAVLAGDDASALAFADHLAAGWAAYAAVLAGIAPPVPSGDASLGRCAATWRAWARRIAGHVEARRPAITRGELGRGAILRIA